MAFPQVFQPKVVHEQSGSVDCGCFAIAYAVDIFLGFDPGAVFFDQGRMREHIMECLEKKKISRFPIHRTSDHSQATVEVTHAFPDEEKWITPKNASSQECKVEIAPLQLSNRFSPLEETPTQGSSSVHFQVGSGSPERAQHSHTQSNSAERSNIKVTPGHSNARPKATSNSSMIKNLTNNPQRALSKDEAAVLEKGLSFCPSQKHFNKETLAESFFSFFRRMKLREFFSEKEQSQTDSNDSEQAFSVKEKWEDFNSGWYPQEVRQNRSQGLRNFIKNVLLDAKQSLTNNRSNFYNNMHDKQRAALTSLQNDKSIVIKPSDKCGSIVIMNTADYETSCLDFLSDTTYYEELPNDPNPHYCNLVQEECGKLLSTGHLTQRQFHSLTEHGTTPALYGLPKMHKPFAQFPSMRPICSGTNSPTAKISQFVDTFLKPCAEQTSSYIKDTTHFLQKLSAFSANTATDNGSKPFLVTMDVVSLYPNIDHSEGVASCLSHLERNKPRVPITILRRLLNLILKCNTMVFKDRFFHQIKGTAMGTGMAVNYANIFMAELEQKMLDAFFTKTGLKPATWLRFIDDVFLVWEHDEESLKSFLSFCNNFAASQNMKSTITFTHSYSSSSVNFLDTTISIGPNGEFLSDIFAKPTAAFQYLHQSSYHDPHLTRAIPKSQFIRIRRICSSLELYWKHVSTYTAFFTNRGYSLACLKSAATEVSKYKREELLFPQKKVKQNRIPLILPYHHKFKGFSNILHTQYNKMITDNPNMKEIFPEPPMIAYRRAQNLQDRLVRAKHWFCKSKSVIPPHNSSDKTKIKDLMNHTGVIKNKQNNKEQKISGGNSTSRNVVYSVECLKHELIYVGMTTDQLNCRINRHRSDINLYPDRCELPKHFHTHHCDFEKDIKISVLEHVKGNRSKLKIQEDKWISMLGTTGTTGMNGSATNFVHIYKSLFE